MEFVQNFPFVCIVFSLTCGVVCAVLKGNAAKRLCTIWIFITVIMSAGVLLYTLQTGENFVYTMGRWSAPWGNELRVGILEALLATVFSGVMLMSLYGGMHHIFEDCDSEKSNLYFTMICLLMSSLFALIYTNDLFTAYVFVEINTIASCALVMLKSSGKTLVATTKYMIMSLLGSGLMLLGIATIYGITGELLMENIGQKIRELYNEGSYAVSITVIIAFFSIGLGIKSALFPFHSWLPDAHGNATASSSAVLSGLVIKGYIIVLIKIFYRVIGIDIIATEKITNVLFVFGIVAMIYGSICAIRERDLKRMLAYSSVAQVGYIFVGIGINTEAGMQAACIQIIAHALTKPMLFCAAGGFMDVSGGSKDMAELTGAGRRDKLGGVAFIVGSLSMIGIPLFSGFVTKFYLTTAAASSGTRVMPFALAAIAISTLLNALYYIPAVFNLFSRKRDGKPAIEKAHYHWEYIVAMVVFIIANIGFGTFSEQIVGAIRSGLEMFGI